MPDTRFRRLIGLAPAARHRIEPSFVPVTLLKLSIVQARRFFSMELKLVIDDDHVMAKIEYEMTVELSGNKEKVEFVKDLIEKAVDERNSKVENFNKWTLK